MSSINKNIQIISVSALNNYLKSIVNENIFLNNLLIKGEISNFKQYDQGHTYFSLKDEQSNIRCILYKWKRNNVNIELKDGVKVIISGALDVYPPQGTFQIIVNDVKLDGIGNLHLQLEQLKKKLNEENLFSSEFKKPIPKFPQHIGVISGSGSAALKDVLTTLQRRWPIAKVSVFTSLVQGENAAKEIISALEEAKKEPLDVLILTRGGGSIEDLWCFNDETLARTIFAYPIPIVSAIGHEIDTTIAELVSDLRASTPTAAAELVSPNINDVYKLINSYKTNLNHYINSKMNSIKLHLAMLSASLDIKNYLNYLNIKQKEYEIIKNDFLLLKNNFLENQFKIIEDKKNLLITLTENKLIATKTNFNNLLIKLDALSPLKILKRGYASVRKKDVIVTSIDNIKVNDPIEVQFSDGKVSAIVDKKTKFDK